MPADPKLLVAGLCACRCHGEYDTGTPFLVFCTAPVPAVTACGTCRDHHAPALAGRPAGIAKP